MFCEQRIEECEGRLATHSFVIIVQLQKFLLVVEEACKFGGGHPRLPEVDLASKRTLSPSEVDAVLKSTPCSLVSGPHHPHLLHRILSFLLDGNLDHRLVLGFHQRLFEAFFECRVLLCELAC